MQVLIYMLRHAYKSYNNAKFRYNLRTLHKDKNTGRTIFGIDIWIKLMFQTHVTQKELLYLARNCVCVCACCNYKFSFNLDCWAIMCSGVFHGLNSQLVRQKKNSGLDVCAWSLPGGTNKSVRLVCLRQQQQQASENISKCNIVVTRNVLRLYFFKNYMLHLEFGVKHKSLVYYSLSKIWEFFLNF